MLMKRGELVWSEGPFQVRYEAGMSEYEGSEYGGTCYYPARVLMYQGDRHLGTLHSKSGGVVTKGRYGKGKLFECVQFAKQVAKGNPAAIARLPKYRAR